MVKETISALKGYLKDVPQDKKFWCSDGKVFKSIEELCNSLKPMKSKTFMSHVNKYKNDFAKWIYDVIGDVKLSESLRDVNNKSETEKKIKARVSSIKRRTRS